MIRTRTVDRILREHAADAGLEQAAVVIAGHDHINTGRHRCSSEGIGARRLVRTGGRSMKIHSKRSAIAFG